MKPCFASVLLVLVALCVGVGTLHAEIACAPGQVIVAFDRGTSAARRTAVLQRAAGTIREALPGGALLMSVTPGSEHALAVRLATEPGVRFAEPNYVRYAQAEPNDPLYQNYQWNIRLINANSAWQQSTGSGVVVAVLDSGISSFGVDGFDDRVIGSYNAIAGMYGFAEDYNGHGTHVAGTVAQATNNGIGVAGVAPDAELLAVKVLNRFGSGLVTGIARGIRWATDHGADIINLSLGSYAASWLEAEAIQYAVDHGVLVVAASGNYHEDLGQSSDVMYPAAFADVLAVGAVTAESSSNPPFRAYFSCYGPELDLVAPGVNIRQETFAVLPRLSFSWDYYDFFGTSQAAPHVSGVAALVMAAHPEWRGAQVAAALTATARDLGSAGFDEEYGYGLVDAVAAINY